MLLLLVSLQFLLVDCHGQFRPLADLLGAPRDHQMQK
uniref:Uncharacterized protein n=1 Tax=Arundo donax TaxID=35708 RepID=A0A0A9A2B6_ARUDO